MEQVQDQKKTKTIQQSVTWENIFEDLKEEFVPELVEQIQEEYSNYPTNIQSDSIDSYLENMNQPNLYLIQAPGGSGKTLSFVIPAVIHAIKNYTGEPNHKIVSKKDKGRMKDFWFYYPKVIIMADTKVLIEQIDEQIEKCLPESQNKIKRTCMYSGQMTQEDLNGFGDILLCTPQILQTLMTSPKDHVYLDNCGLLICDEAELIYDSFQPSFEYILTDLAKIQKASFIAASATLTQQYNDFASKIFFQGDSKKRPIKNFINLTLEGVTQYQNMIPYAKDNNQQYELVFQEIIKLLRYIYLEEQLSTQVMIFFDAIQLIDKFNEEILKDEEISQGPKKIQFDVIHSRMEMRKDDKTGRMVVDKKKQNQRLKQTYQDFRDNKFPVLLCTDIMARGIDIRKVGLVISVFAPRVNAKDNASSINGPKYMHRIARTGRYNKEGVSLIYLRHNNSEFEQPDSKLEEVLNSKVQGLENNKIDNLEIGKDYIKIVGEKAAQAVKYNEEQAKQKQ